MIFFLNLKEGASWYTGTKISEKTKSQISRVRNFYVGNPGSHPNTRIYCSIFKEPPSNFDFFFFFSTCVKIGHCFEKKRNNDRQILFLVIEGGKGNFWFKWFEFEEYLKPKEF